MKYRYIKNLLLASFLLLFLLFFNDRQVSLAEVILGHTPSLSDRIDGFLSRYQWKQAVALMEVEADQNPLDMDAAERLSSWYALLEWTEKNRQLSEKVSETVPDSIYPIYFSALPYAYPLVDLPKDPQACQARNEALHPYIINMITTGQRSAPGYYLEGVGHLLNENWHGAELSFLKALYHNPNHYKSLVGLSLTYLKLRTPNRALPHLQHAFELNPIDVDVLYAMGMFYFGQENYPRAEQYFRLSQRLDPQKRRTREYWIEQTEFQLGHGPNPDPAPQNAGNPNSPSDPEPDLEPDLTPDTSPLEMSPRHTP